MATPAQSPVEATDLDNGDTLTYSLTGVPMQASFTIDTVDNNGSN